MAGNGNGAKPPSAIQQQPALAAGGITAAASAIMAAFWAVLSDLGVLPQISTATQALVTAAILSVVAMIAAVWAQRQSTSTSSPKLAESTAIAVTNAAGATVGHVQLPSAAEISAAQPAAAPAIVDAPKP